MKCSECGSDQLDGSLFCDECGYNLIQGADETTAVLPFADDDAPWKPSMMPSAEMKQSTRPHTFTFIIPYSGRRVVVNASEELHIGRSEPTRGLVPQLDVTIDDGARHGVSRAHAMIRITNRGPVLLDQGSTNGTFLNNYRLPENMAYLLKNGDEVCFGHLLVHLFFEK